MKTFKIEIECGVDETAHIFCNITTPKNVAGILALRIPKASAKQLSIISSECMELVKMIDRWCE